MLAAARVSVPLPLLIRATWPPLPLLSAITPMKVPEPSPTPTFKIAVPDAAIDDLTRCRAATREAVDVYQRCAIEIEYCRGVLPSR